MTFSVLAASGCFVVFHRVVCVVCVVCSMLMHGGAEVKELVGSLGISTMSFVIRSKITILVPMESQRSPETDGSIHFFPNSKTYPFTTSTCTH